MLQTDRHTSNHQQHGDVKIYIVYVYFPESQSLRFLYYRTVCVCPPAARLSRYMTSYFKGHQNTVRFSSLPLVTTICRTSEFVNK